MKSNKIFKLFTLVVIFLFAVALQAFSAIAQPVLLSKIVIEEDVNNTFNLNLIFNEKFTGNAFIQNRENGTYFVFIPETYIGKKGVDILYRDNKNKSKIKLNVEEMPYVKNNVESKYVKISVSTLKNNSIILVSKTEEEFADEPPIPISFNKYKVIGTVLLLLAAFMLMRVIMISRKNRKQIYSNYIGSSYPIPGVNVPRVDIQNSSETKYNAPSVANVTPPDMHVLPKVNIKESMKSDEGDSFSCFDIPFVSDLEENAIDLNSSIKKSSLSAREKVLKSKITNPILSRNEDSSEFSLPAVDDVVVIEKSKPSLSKTNEPELLSELRITPRKGFYLTTIDDTFALFGFVDNNVYLLKKFSDLSQINLQARFYDRQENGDLYIVRLDSYKAMVEISDTGMKEMAVL